MKVTNSAYLNALETLSKQGQITKPKKPSFKQAAKMSYANQSDIEEKAEVLIATLKEHLRSVPPDPKLFLKKGSTVYVPDIHGDFVHLILTLHRHGLLNQDLSLKKDFNYIFLGDIYNRGKDADIVDYWLNKQIDRGAKIHRLSGNHELLFLRRFPDGNYAIEDVPLDYINNVLGDIQSDVGNDFMITGEILKQIKNGNMLASYPTLDHRFNTPVLYTHSFVHSEDFDALEVERGDVVGFARALNKRFKEHGEASHEAFADGKQKGKYDWEEIRAPFMEDPLFNIFRRNKQGEFTSPIMRVTRRTPASNNNLATNFAHEIPQGVYQIVGHSRVCDFDLPTGSPTNRPIIVADGDRKAFVQFSDVSMGFEYKPRSLNRKNLVMNSHFAREVN